MSIGHVAEGRAALLEAARGEIADKGVDGVSLRTIARRAGLSHAAPSYFFGDRAGMLTAVATEGFLELAGALEAAAADRGATLSVLGRVYVDFGIAHPGLFDLMFRPAVLRSDDAALIAARDEAIGVLSGAFSGSGAPADGAVPVMALVSWTFAHGLVSLARDGALQNISRDADVARLTGALIDAYEAALS